MKHGTTRRKTIKLTFFQDLRVSVAVIFNIQGLT